MLDSAERERLDHLVESCLSRGKRPIPLPHCAICARYANENLAFEGVLALIDSLSDEDSQQVAADVENTITSVPSGFRQQLVTAENFSTLLSAPSWRLVRGMVIDLYGRGIEEHFENPYLTNIQEITLLGGAYGGPDISPEFMSALVRSPSLTNVTRLVLHSGEVGLESSKIFWNSEFASNLIEIDGMPFYEKEFDRVLNAKLIRGLACSGWSRFSKNVYSFPAVAKLESTPCLEELSLLTSIEEDDGLPSFIESIFGDLERLQNVDILLGMAKTEDVSSFSKVTLPKSVRSVTWRVEPEHGSIVRHECDLLSVFRPSENDSRLVCDTHNVTEYETCLFEFGILPDLSTRIKKLNVIFPPDQSIENIIDSLSQFDQLEELTIMYPFSFAQAKSFSESPMVNRLTSLKLLLSLTTGNSTTDYIEEHQNDSHKTAPNLKSAES